MNYRNAEATMVLAMRSQQSTENMEVMTKDMHIIAQKTKQETVSMRIITLVTLFFLPGTFISVSQRSFQFRTVIKVNRLRVTTRWYKAIGRLSWVQILFNFNLAARESHKKSFSWTQYSCIWQSPFPLLSLCLYLGMGCIGGLIGKNGWKKRGNNFLQDP